MKLNQHSDYYQIRRFRIYGRWHWQILLESFVQAKVGEAFFQFHNQTIYRNGSDTEMDQTELHKRGGDTKTPNFLMSDQEINSMGKLKLLLLKLAITTESSKSDFELLNFVVEEDSRDTMNNPENKQWIREQISPEFSLETQMTRLKLLYIWNIM